MHRGYIKLYRKLLDSHVINRDKDYFVVWIKLLLLATHTKINKYFKGKLIILKPGQMITGRKFLSSICDVQESKIERILKCLESEQLIEQQKSNKNRLIGIKNWSEHQQSEQLNEQLVNNKRTTDEQPVNTYKNGKNGKNKYNTFFKKNENPELSEDERKSNKAAYRRMAENSSHAQTPKKSLTKAQIEANRISRQKLIDDTRPNFN